MLKISRLADYAILILGALSKQAPGVCVSASQLAEATALTQATVSKLLKLLSEAKLVSATRGTQGGYFLTRPAEQITLAMIVTAIDGRPSVTECSNEQPSCAQMGVCTLHGNWQLINHLLLDCLNSITLTQMAKPLRVQSYARLETYSS